MQSGTRPLLLTLFAEDKPWSCSTSRLTTSRKAAISLKWERCYAASRNASVATGCYEG
jgi:hypothetical protein